VRAECYDPRVPAVSRAICSCGGQRLAWEARKPRSFRGKHAVLPTVLPN
jgi:hypothetical protein